MAILMPHTHDISVLHQLALFPGTLGHPIIPGPPILHMLPLEFIHLDAYGNSYVKLLSNDPTKNCSVIPHPGKELLPPTHGTSTC